MSDEFIMPKVNPLNANHLADINKALEAIKVGLQQAELAKRVGLDVSKHEEYLREMQSKFEAIKQVYFPGQ